MTNPFDDVELDATGMRALAHPVRLAILTRLQGSGPSTATLLAPEVGATPSVASWHLRHLAKHGLVRDAAPPPEGSGRERWWEAASRGFRYAGGGAAAQALTEVIEQVEGDLVGTWRREVQPRLDGPWADLAGRANTTVLVTADELGAVEAAIEQLLAPYVRRKDEPETVPGGAREVRLLRYVLPGAQDRR